MLKVGLAGAGGISGAHIPAWEAMEDAELTALCDIRREQMERYPEKRWYLDFEEMLKKGGIGHSGYLSAHLPSCGFFDKGHEQGNPCAL